MTINGAGANTAKIDGNNTVPVLTVSTFFVPNATLTINNVTIQHGHYQGGGSGGGGISNAGTLVLNSSIVSNNISGATGGGIQNGGTLVLNSSIVSGNRAVGGGGVYSSGDSTTVTNS